MDKFNQFVRSNIGNQHAFHDLIDGRESEVSCYRILASEQDAGDISRSRSVC
jgi:hypothetical protein